MMKSILPIFPVFLLFSVSHLFADLQKGLDAYNNGDYATALNEWKPHAEQGHALAQFSLGVMYDKGHGVPENDVYAYMRWDIASSLGNEVAKTNKDIIAREMTRVQIAEAQVLSWKCLNSNYEDCE